MRAAGAAPGRRLLLLLYKLQYHGMELLLVDLARGLAARGDDVVVGCLDVDMDLAPLRDAGVRVVRVTGTSRRERLLSPLRVARLARRADVVHCTAWDASLWGRLGAVLARRPVLVTEHALSRTDQVSRTGSSRAHVVAWHNRLLAPLTYAMIAVAERQVALLRSEGVGAERLVVIPNGVPVARIRASAERPADRAGLGIAPDARVVVQVGRLEALKRHRWTLDAVAELRATLGDVHAVFVGDGPERAALERHAAALGGTGWTHFVGTVADVPPYLAIADLAVLPSSTEALPMALIEAMALGVPQVTTDVGDMGRVLADSGGGLSVPVDDEAGFRAACARILGSPERAAEMSQRARSAADGYDVDGMVDRYSALFDAAVAGRPPRALAPEPT